MYSKKQLLLHLAAEVEARFGLPGDPLPWRRRELAHRRVVCGTQLWIDRYLHIERVGNVVLGERVALGPFTQLINYVQIRIGDDFLSDGNLVLNTGTHDPVTLAAELRSISIGNRVWCEPGVTVLAGVSIGDDVIIRAGSLVNKDIPGNSVVSGVPARIVGVLDRSEVIELWTWARPGSIRLPAG